MGFLAGNWLPLGYNPGGTPVLAQTGTEEQRGDKGRRMDG